MPRPRARSFECVRRAWHSDRHQPMRGLIIQQILRVVHRSHADATTKNREWQEKLPIVVLRAEEIMYSKANSEAEYMDPETLWDRVNEAINTIIRTDQSTETGDLLPPCIEAALILGCVAVRASRSQRHTYPQSYLSPTTQGPAETSDKTTNEQNPSLLQLHSGIQIPQIMNSIHLVTESKGEVVQKDSLQNPTSSYNFPMPCNPSMNVGLVHHLYHTTHFQSEMPQLAFPAVRNPGAIIVGRPVFPSLLDPGAKKMGSLQDFVSCEMDKCASYNTNRADFRNNDQKTPELGFDLSLRLGLFTSPCMNLEKASTHTADNVDLSSSSTGSISKLNSLSPHRSNEYSSFHVETVNGPLWLHRSPWNTEGEGQNAPKVLRKRKAPMPFTENLERGIFLSQPELR